MLLLQKSFIINGIWSVGPYLIGEWRGAPLFSSFSLLDGRLEEENGYLFQKSSVESIFFFFPKVLWLPTSTKLHEIWSKYPVLIEDQLWFNTFILNQPSVRWKWLKYVKNLVVVVKICLLKPHCDHIGQVWCTKFGQNGVKISANNLCYRLYGIRVHFHGKN